MRSLESCHAWLVAVVLAGAASGCVGPFVKPSNAPPASAAPAAAPREARDNARPRPGAVAIGDDICDLEGDAAAPPSEDDASDEHATIDDGFEAPAEGDGPASGAPLPFAELSNEEIAARLREDITALGPMSIGRTHGGALVAAVRMPEGENWEVVHPGLAWGTQETVDALTHAIDSVAQRFPGTPKVFIGDISAKRGGHLPPHVSHQSGRDVDLGYYLTDGHRWYANASGSKLDRPRTWHLVRTLLADSDVDLILVDRQIQRALKAYALEIGEDPAWLDQIFQVGGKSKRPVLFHVEGHATHLHVRFFSPAAQELGRRAYRFLIGRRLLSPPTRYVTHTVKAGETLSHLARRYKVTPEAIKKANALKKDTVRLGKPYKIPQTGGIAMPAPVVVPPRRVPPSPTAVAMDEPRSAGGGPCRRASAR
jgi:murein endopeptidase